MSPRAARLVAAAALLAWLGAAAAALVPLLPPGLADACAPEKVLREVLALAAVLVLLVVPACLAGEEGRPAEDHTGLLVAACFAPGAVALAGAGGAAPADLLGAGTLLLACDLAASSYLRADPAGRWGMAWASGAAALLAALPVAAYGLTEFAGVRAAGLAFDLSPLLAVRRAAAAGTGGIGPALPAILLLAAAAAAFRLLPLLARRPGPAARA